MTHILILAAAPAGSSVLSGLAVLLALASAALLSGALAWKAGRESGRIDGREEGVAEGRDDGYLAGKLEGVNAGYRDGHADGRRIGRADALMRVQARVEQLIHPGEADA